MQEAISAAQAALLLGVHRNTVFAWAKLGIIHAYKLGPRVVRFNRNEIIEMVGSRGQNIQTQEQSRESVIKLVR